MVKLELNQLKTLDINDSINKAIDIFEEDSSETIFVIDDNYFLYGIITIGDLQRKYERIIIGISYDEKAFEVMNKKFKFIEQNITGGGRNCLSTNI